MLLTHDGRKRSINRLFEISLFVFLFFSFQDKLLTKLEENEPELASSQEDEVNFVSFHLQFRKLLYYCLLYTHTRIFSVCYLRQCKSYHADCTLWTSSCLQKVLRQNHTNGRFTETFAPQMRHMQSENFTIETNSHSSRRKNSNDLCKT